MSMRGRGQGAAVKALVVNLAVTIVGVCWQVVAAAKVKGGLVSGGSMLWVSPHFPEREED